MAHRDYAPARINVNVEGLDKIADRLKASLSTIDAIQHELTVHGRIAQRRAVANVSGVVRSYKGRNFIVNRVTGKLARSIQVSQPNPLAITIEATAEYASDVELGTRGPVDLKKTKLAGKIVPLPVSLAQTRLLTSPQRKSVVSIFVGRFNSKQVSTSGFKANRKMATTGKAMGITGIMFRRVPGPGGEGWIIPQRPPRPFMEEAGAYTAPLLKDAVEAAFKEFLEEGDA